MLEEIEHENDVVEASRAALSIHLVLNVPLLPKQSESTTRRASKRRESVHGDVALLMNRRGSRRIMKMVKFTDESKKEAAKFRKILVILISRKPGRKLTNLVMQRTLTFYLIYASTQYIN